MFLIKLSDLAEISPQINSNAEGAGGQMASSSTQEGREPGEQCLSHKHGPSFEESHGYRGVSAHANPTPDPPILPAFAHILYPTRSWE